MSKLDKLEFIAGTVVEVQIIERQVEGGPGAVTGGGASIIGRQRIFLDGPGVADPHYDFDCCELAVRRDQEIAFARMPGGGGKTANVMLYNRTMGTQWPFNDAIDRLAPKPLMNARALALLAGIVLTVLAGVLVGAVIKPGDLMSAILYGAVAGVAGFVVLWIVLAAMRIGSAKRKREMVVAALIEKLKAAPVKAA